MRGGWCAVPRGSAFLFMRRAALAAWRDRKPKLPMFFEAVKALTSKNTICPGEIRKKRRRWVIERTFSWLRRNRRLMAHYEALAVIAEGFAKLAMISVKLKRLTEPKLTPKVET